MDGFSTVGGVIVSFTASGRHRLEEAAAAGSRSARAAIAGVSELSLMLAGAQLGITLCTLGLGSLAEPAVAQLLVDLLREISQWRPVK
jgi:CBS domain containing-hemolysin-like protein